eukprot:CAMPEP_0206033012 /NCGR_PEP_ID=MMETSP1466-20131121/357_1 /ASSEMBLY_ACC=CAM_ASM_001126 /TAXON_ID=44452 /ORGANISM="Pavlova gyrans, Strain CCMP608" /LENGTH=157 /DNA_ID=CAMNT_0053407175 /DNA_START=10 /DNA_END=484 /DNA_ORIENTATION=+
MDMFRVGAIDFAADAVLLEKSGKDCAGHSAHRERHGTHGQWHCVYQFDEPVIDVDIAVSTLSTLSKESEPRAHNDHQDEYVSLKQTLNTTLVWRARQAHSHISQSLQSLRRSFEAMLYAFRGSRRVAASAALRCGNGLAPAFARAPRGLSASPTCLM